MNLYRSPKRKLGKNFHAISDIIYTIPNICGIPNAISEDKYMNINQRRQIIFKRYETLYES